MATITRMKAGKMQSRTVKNLGWFFKHARTTEITHFSMRESNDGWEMFVDFADGWSYHTHYASFEVFKRTMERQRSLRGVPITIVDRDGGSATVTLQSRGVIGHWS